MNHVGKETKIVIRGKQYTLSRLDRGVLKDFADWYYSQIPNPLALASEYVGNFPPELQKLLVTQAWEDSKKRRDFDSQEVRECMATVDGACKILSMLLEKHHPDLTEDDALDLAVWYFEEQSEARVNELVSLGYTDAESRKIALEEAIGGTFRQGDPKVRGEASGGPGGRPEGDVHHQGVGANAAT